MHHLATDITSGDRTTGYLQSGKMVVLFHNMFDHSIVDSFRRNTEHWVHYSNSIFFFGVYVFRFVRFDSINSLNNIIFSISSRLIFSLIQVQQFFRCSLWLSSNFCTLTFRLHFIFRSSFTIFLIVHWLLLKSAAIARELFLVRWLFISFLTKLINLLVRRVRLLVVRWTLFANIFDISSAFSTFL